MFKIGLAFVVRVRTTCLIKFSCLQCVFPVSVAFNLICMQAGGNTENENYSIKIGEHEINILTEIRILDYYC